MKIVWDNEIKAWIDEETGMLIAPRLDSDGIDFFFVLRRTDENAVARYCSGEGYWAFERWDKPTAEYFDEMIRQIRSTIFSDKFAEVARKRLPTV